MDAAKRERNPVCDFWETVGGWVLNAALLGFRIAAVLHT